MSTDFDTVIEKFIKFMHTLSDDRVEEFKAISSPALNWRDPLTDAKGIDSVIAYFGKLNELMGDIEIQTKSHSRNDNIVLLHMVMTFHMKAKPKDKMEVDYLCKVTLDDNGLLTEVVEYWDASPFLEAIPLLGQVIKLTRKLTRAKLAT